MTQTFNKVHYIELLKKDRGLEIKNSSLYKEDRMEYRELLSYKVILYNQIIYNRRHEYISLIHKYVTNEIDSFLLRLGNCILYQIKKQFFLNFYLDYKKLVRLLMSISKKNCKSSESSRQATRKNSSSRNSTP